MITNFKIFEKQDINENIKTSFIIKDLATYFLEKYGNESDIKIIDFFDSLSKIKNIKIAFECEKCTIKRNLSIIKYINWYKFHMGVIDKIICDSNIKYDRLLVDLNITLKRIKYTHDVDTEKRFYIIGELPQSFQNILDDFEIYKSSKKYNL